MSNWLQNLKVSIFNLCFVICFSIILHQNTQPAPAGYPHPINQAQPGVVVIQPQSNVVPGKQYKFKIVEWQWI